MSQDNDLHVVTEVGVFGELNIDDPTKKKVKKANESLDDVIAEAVQENLNNLSK